MTATDPIDQGLQRRSLRAFSGSGYEKGRGRLWQAAWFACMNLVFCAWWCPKAWRPRILRAFGATVGDRCFIRHRVRVLWPWKLSLGDDCWIGEDAWLLNLEAIRIGNDVCISQGAFLCTGSHDKRSLSFEFDNGPIVIGDGAWIATQSLVLRGVRVGAHAVIGARAVVTKAVPTGITVPVASRW